MAIQTIDLKVPNGDTPRSANTKINANFSNNSHAASKLVGKSSGQVPTIEGANGVAGTGLAGHGVTFGLVESNEDLLQRLCDIGSCFFRGPNNSGLMSNQAGAGIFSRNFSTYMGISTSYSSNGKDITIFAGDLSADTPDYTRYQIYKVYSDKNTTLDGNGALKPSSPVLRVFSDRIEGNGDGDLMAATYTKNGVGDYTITGTTGLRTDGWYIVIPNDMNGNPKVAVTLDDTDGVITLKTYERIFDMATFKFVPDLEQPLDIPDGRWIDLRFNDLPIDNELPQ